MLQAWVRAAESTPHCPEVRRVRTRFPIDPESTAGRKSHNSKLYRDQPATEEFVTFTFYASVGVGPGVAMGNFRSVSFELEILGGKRIRFVHIPESPTPHPSIDGSLGPEVPRTLTNGTLHAKPKTIRKLPHDGFKPKE